MAPPIRWGRAVLELSLALTESLTLAMKDREREPHIESADEQLIRRIRLGLAAVLGQCSERKCHDRALVAFGDTNGRHVE